MDSSNEWILNNLKLIDTFKDGRVSLYELYKKHFELETSYGWKKQLIYSIDVITPKETINIPIYGYLSPKKGKSLWLLTGIHGEEPAGPNAVYSQIKQIGLLGKKIPMVVMPMLNPAGYYRDWRFHHYHRKPGKLNVTDACHVTPDPKNPSKPKIKEPVHAIAGIFTNYVLSLLKTYPPVLYFDLHEDEVLKEGYIYSQGCLAGLDPVAAETIRILKTSGVKIQMSGRTRFPNELIKNGIVVDDRGKSVKDGSIDEFIANPTYFNKKGQLLPKPFAATAIMVETPPASDLSLTTRIRAHENIIKNLETFWKIVKSQLVDPSMSASYREYY